MKRNIIFLLTLATALLVSCGGDEPSGGGAPSPTPTPTPTPPPTPPTPTTPTYPFDPESGETLSADGDSAKTYDLIADAGYGNESPDLFGVNTDVQHITQRFDETLGWYVFDFTILLTDDDRGIATTTDRQRNEIKTDAHSPKSLLAYENETMRYQWYFRIPEGWQTTSSFCHIHQIKGFGGSDISMPVITFTTVDSGSEKSGQQFQIREVSGKVEGSDITYLARRELSDFVGEWVKAEETIHYSYNSGKYSVTITRCSDDEVLVAVDNASIQGWRTGATAMRPKWGIYRSIGSNGSKLGELRDETMSFAEFTIDKQ